MASPVKIRHLFRNVNWRSFPLQLILLTVLPLAVLTLVVAFGSQSLHHQAMRSLVGDRDLLAVRAAANMLGQELSHRALIIQILARSMENRANLENLLIKPGEITTSLDDGLALFSPTGRLITSSNSATIWNDNSIQMSDAIADLIHRSSEQVAFSHLLSLDSSDHKTVFIGALTPDGNLLAGAFSPANMIHNSLKNSIYEDQTNVLVIKPDNTNNGFEILYQAGEEKSTEQLSTHPAIIDALKGKSGINYYQTSQGEHVVAFSPITPIGWGLIIEESWENIASPYLRSTQAAPLVLVPVLLLALMAIWFGVHRIVQPLQALENRAAELAKGDFEAIHQPVGGISEIRHLQAELIAMAEKLKTAQQNLRVYFGAITAGIENERRNLALELHDDTIQSLIVLNQHIQLASLNSTQSQKDLLKELQQLVGQTMLNLRRMIRGLRPIYLEDLGLVTALEMLAQETNQHTNLPVSFQTGGDEHRLDAEKEIAIYRMVQESLSNITRHAQASHAWLELTYAPTFLRVLIRDNGKGFTVPTNFSEFSRKSHFGLLGLRERAGLIGANLEITSTPGRGTTVLIHLSIPPNEQFSSRV